MDVSSDGFSLRQLRYFVAVADAGTLAGAAQQLHISQSAVSLSIGQLERSLGVQLLLRRRARGIELTDAARRVLPEARSLLAHAGEVRSTARSLGQALTGELTVGCFPTLTPFVLPEVLRGFSGQHPDVRIRLFEGSMAELASRVVGGTCEMALMYDLGIPADVEHTLLYRVRPYVLLGPDHPLAAESGPLPLAELAGEPMVMLDLPPSSEMFAQVLASGGVVPDVRFVSTHFETVRSLVATGAGYSLLLQRPSPEFTYAGPPVVHREIADEVLGVDVVLAWARDARLTRRARAFARYCATTVAAAPDPAAGMARRRRPASGAATEG